MVDDDGRKDDRGNDDGRRDGCLRCVHNTHARRFIRQEGRLHHTDTCRPIRAITLEKQKIFHHIQKQIQDFAPIKQTVNSDFTQLITRKMRQV